VADIKGALGWLGLVEYLELWDMLAGVNLNNTDDIHRWKPEASGEFSTRSAYKNFFVGAITFEPWKKVWKSWAPVKYKTFVWLAIRNRCWTTDRLQKEATLILSVARSATRKRKIFSTSSLLVFLLGNSGLPFCSH